MRESLMYGSVRGARGNSRPYRDGINIGQLNTKIEPVSSKPAPEKHWFNGG